MTNATRQTPQLENWQRLELEQEAACPALRLIREDYRLNGCRALSEAGLVRIVTSGERGTLLADVAGMVAA